MTSSCSTRSPNCDPDDPRFNSHRQFDRLRADGRYAKMQAATRKRDTALQGSINPNLADFGSAPETRQYSGRKVEADWTCPFHARKPR